MRTREEIENNAAGWSRDDNVTHVHDMGLLLEVLLDIRELLEHKKGS